MCSFPPDGYLPLKTDIPMVMVTHDVAHLHYPDQIPFLVRRYYDYYVPRFLTKAQKVITVSEFSKTDILQHFPENHSKLAVIYNGGRSNFQPLSAAEKSMTLTNYSKDLPYFFFIGSIHPRKKCRTPVTGL